MENVQTAVIKPKKKKLSLDANKSGAIYTAGFSQMNERPHNNLIQ